MTDSKKILVGISGGVDSAVAALLLQRQGYQVHGVFMKNWSEDDFGGPCPWEEDQASAQVVAQHLGIPIETWNFEPEYRERVFQVMLHEYQQGRTPNPDILCNREIKFNLFLERALTHAPLMATGHYARTHDGRLYKASDQTKDQSYFLAAVSSKALKQTVFPLGEQKKTAVRAIAKDAKLPNWDRPDSVGICFVGEKKMVEFLSRYLTWSPGPIILSDGTEIGQHRGLQFYTIGQRRGFGADIDAAKVSQHLGQTQALYIAEKRSATNTLVLAPADQPTQLERQEFRVSEAHWIRHACVFPWIGQAKFRYRQPDVPITLVPDGHRLRVICATPQRAITPGQYAVFYQGDECIGSAVIDTFQANS